MKVRVPTLSLPAHIDKSRIGHELNGNAIRKLKAGDMIHVVYLAMVGANQGSFHGSRLVHQPDMEGPYLIIESTKPKKELVEHGKRPPTMEDTGYLNLSVISSNGLRRHIQWSRMSNSKFFMYHKGSL